MAVVGVDTLLFVSYSYIILLFCALRQHCYIYIRNSTIIIYSLLPCAKLSRKDPETITSKKKKKVDMGCCCGEDCECRPLGFLLGLPFAFVSLLLSLIGVVIWIVGLTLTCICPCCLCVTLIVEFALALIKAPFSVMKWFTSKIPC